MPDLPNRPRRPTKQPPAKPGTENERQEEPVQFNTQELAGMLAQFHEHREAENSARQKELLEETKRLNDPNGPVLRQLKEMNYYLYCIAKGRDPDAEETQQAIEKE